MIKKDLEKENLRVNNTLVVGNKIVTKDVLVSGNVTVAGNIFAANFPGPSPSPGSSSLKTVTKVFGYSDIRSFFTSPPKMVEAEVGKSFVPVACTLIMQNPGPGPSFTGGTTLSFRYNVVDPCILIDTFVNKNSRDIVQTPFAIQIMNYGGPSTNSYGNSIVGLPIYLYTGADFADGNVLSTLTVILSYLEIS